ncbi:winged helix-turn-helix transcriptional regulator [Kribbella endophytica]
MPETSTAQQEHSEGECDLARTVLSLIGDKWSLLVLGHLADQPLRFNELRRVLAPITQRMLSQSLRALERDGLVSRTVYPTVPPKVEYAVTEVGRSFNGVVGVIAAWTDENLAAVTEARAVYAAKAG